MNNMRAYLRPIRPRETIKCRRNTHALTSQTQGVLHARRRTVPAAKRNGRTRRERANADNLKSQCRQPCARCGQPIDYTAPPGDPNSFNAGHIKAWALHPELREDPSNLQPEHESCGKSAQTRDGQDNGLGVTSTDW